MALPKKLLWQVYAPIYDSLLLLKPYSEYLAHCADLLDVRSGESLLDVGCGTANLLLKVKRGRIVGLDGASFMLSLAKLKTFLLGLWRRSAQKVWFLRADGIQSLPFFENTFDHVACLSTIHSFPDPESSVSEMIRVLKPGGRLLLTVPLPITTGSIVKDHLQNASLPRLILSFIALPILLFVLIINLLQEKWHRDGIYKFLTTEEVIDIVNRLGLEVIMVEKCFSGTYTLLLARKVEP